MRAGVMSAGIFGIANRVRPEVREEESRQQVFQEQVHAHPAGWSEEIFARQQIRNLTRQVFSYGRGDVRHVVFGGVDIDVSVNDVCLRVGNALSFERQEDVLVVLGYRVEGPEVGANWTTPIRSCASRVNRNLWQLTVPRSCSSDANGRDHRSLMQLIRSEFAYSIIAGSVVSSMNSSLAESADGMVVVLSALRTRRAAARKLLDELTHVRVLGTVLQDREFPIPEGIYRRL